MTFPYSELQNIRNLLHYMGLQSYNYGSFEEFYITRPNLANLTLAEIHKDMSGFSILFYKIYIKNNNLLNDKSERTWVFNEDDLNKILDEYSLVLKQYIQIMELKKIKRDFM